MRLYSVYCVQRYWLLGSIEEREYQTQKQNECRTCENVETAIMTPVFWESTFWLYVYCILIVNMFPFWFEGLFRFWDIVWLRTDTAAVEWWKGYTSIQVPSNSFFPNSWIYSDSELPECVACVADCQCGEIFGLKQVTAVRRDSKK